LIASLRAHLARLTSELSDHKAFLAELRALRDTDAKKLKDKSEEVDKLKEEVERLGGEVEVLKVVVEEGLRQRRANKDLSEVVVDAFEGDQPQENTENKPENISPPARTDQATLGSSSVPEPSMTGGLVDSVELERITIEMEERRSSSTSGIGQAHSGALPPSGSRVASPSGRHQRHHVSFRPYAPTPIHARRNKDNGNDMETPFPQIRGGHLERLFFSAPEHNPKTCTVCRRRRRPHGESPLSWLPLTNLRAGMNDEDKGVAEGSESDSKETEYHVPKSFKAKGKQKEHVAPVSQAPRSSSWKRNSEQDRVPPQTVLARVLRELENDFAHYKRWVVLIVLHHIVS
jgi:hypothetical protein